MKEEDEEDNKTWEVVKVVVFVRTLRCVTVNGISYIHSEVRDWQEWEGKSEEWQVVRYTWRYMTTSMVIDTSFRSTGMTRNPFHYGLPVFALLPELFLMFLLCFNYSSRKKDMTSLFCLSPLNAASSISFQELCLLHQFLVLLFCHHRRRRDLFSFEFKKKSILWETSETPFREQRTPLSFRRKRSNVR